MKTGWLASVGLASPAQGFRLGKRGGAWWRAPLRWMAEGDISEGNPGVAGGLTLERPTGEGHNRPRGWLATRVAIGDSGFG